MTAARDRREELEALLWAEGLPAPLVALVLAGADAIVKASRPPARKPGKPARPKKPSAVHYDAGTGHPACRAHDFFTAVNWLLTAELLDVSCQRCTKALARQEAGEAP